MSRPDATRLAGLAMVALLLPVGCGGEGPGAPAGQGGGGGVSLSDLKSVPKAEGGATRVTMIVPGGPVSLTSLWEEAARVEAANQGAVFAVRSPGPGESQADLVRQADLGGASVLIVVPGDDPEGLASAMEEARGKGIEALSLFEPVSGEGEGVPVVVWEDVRKAADALVAAASEDATAIGKSAEGPALVLAVEGFPGSDAHAEALWDAAGASGVALIGDGPRVVSPGEEAARAAIREVMAEHPELSMVLAGDDFSYRAAVEERVERGETGGFVAVGFVIDPNMPGPVADNLASAVALVDEAAMAEVAVRNAMALQRGEAVPDRIIAPLPIHRAPGPPTTVVPEVEPEGHIAPTAAGGPSHH